MTDLAFTVHGAPPTRLVFTGPDGVERVVLLSVSVLRVVDTGRQDLEGNPEFQYDVNVQLAMQPPGAVAVEAP